MEYPLKPVGIVHSCFKEKFGIPRQPGLVQAAEATLELLPPWDREEAVRGLETFSHLWILFWFHRAGRRQCKPTVRPPRLGGNQRIGVFASRSPFRPNPIGLSAVELVGIERRDGVLQLQLRGVDLLDATPVLDIKPYLPYADRIADAQGGFALQAPGGSLQVGFSAVAESLLNSLGDGEAKHLRRLVTQVLQQDPRPAYLDVAQQRREFGMRLLDFNIRWVMDNENALVLAIQPSNEE